MEVLTATRLDVCVVGQINPDMILYGSDFSGAANPIYCPSLESGTRCQVKKNDVPDSSASSSHAV